MIASPRMARWSFGSLWACVVFSIAGCAAARVPSSDALIGTWRGSAEFRGAILDFEVRFARHADTLRAAMSAPDLMLLDEPLDSVRYQAPRVRFTTPDDHPLRFEGMLDGDSIRGSAVVPAVPGVVEAGGSSADLRFALGRASSPPAPPYAAREVRIDAKGARLAGTLYVPSTGTSPHAAIVILQGSSTNLRRDYRFYADRFARSGFVTLVFDKRGNGASSGDYGSATYEDLADDAAAAVEFLRAEPEVARDRVGIWGLSQGAFIAPLVAERSPSLRFIVAVSPPGMTIGACAAHQDSVRLIAAGFSTVDAARAAECNRRLGAWLADGAGEGALAAELTRVAETKWRRASSIPVRLPSGPARNGWYWRGRTLDPIPFWRRLRVPVLVAFGAADELLPAAISAARIERALREGGNPEFTVRVFPGANHVLRRLPLEAGGAWDWPRAAPGFLELLTRWTADHSGDSSIARSPAGGRTKIMHVRSKDGTLIAVECAGSGPTLIIVHGGIGDRTRWTPMFPLLSSHFTVCAMDRRGHGASGDSPDYSLQKEAEDVAAVVASRPGEVFVLGHSYGGVAALEATFLTDRISKLILYEPPLQDPIDQNLAVADTMERMMRAGEGEQAVVTFLRNIVNLSPGEVAEMRSRPSWPGLAATGEVQLRQIRALAAYRFDAKRISTVGMPTLLLTGSETGSVYLKQAIRSLQATLPNPTLVVLEGEQHNAMDTARQRLAAVITSFLLGTTDGNK